MVERTVHFNTAPLIVFAGGGTGGHLYPALAVASVLRERIPDVRIRFFGTQRPVDRRILDSEDCELVAQSLTPLGRAPWGWPRAFLGLRSSQKRCRSDFKSERPVVVVGTGGLASVPAVTAAAKAGIPTALLNPDALPGRANRFLAGSVDLVFAQFEESKSHLPRRIPVLVTGCPVRADFTTDTREGSIARFGLNLARKTLLVTGASQGAKTINDVIVSNLDYLEKLSHWQVLHVTGDRDFESVKSAYSDRALTSVVVPFTDHMSSALAAADLVVSRAGASTLAELTARGRASILMPYPFDRALHQMANARCLESKSAARVVEDRMEERINAPAVRAALEELTTDDAKRDAMALAARRLGKPSAAADIADAILGLASARGDLVRGESLKVSS